MRPLLFIQKLMQFQVGFLVLWKQYSFPYRDRGLSCCRSDVLFCSTSGFPIELISMSCCPAKFVLFCHLFINSRTIRCTFAPNNQAANKQVLFCRDFRSRGCNFAPGAKSIRTLGRTVHATIFSGSFPVSSAFMAFQSGRTTRFRPAQGVLIGLSPG
jgi:hypothetical protein